MNTRHGPIRRYDRVQANSALRKENERLKRRVERLRKSVKRCDNRYRTALSVIRTLLALPLSPALCCGAQWVSYLRIRKRYGKHGGKKAA